MIDLSAMICCHPETMRAFIASDRSINQNIFRSFTKGAYWNVSRWSKGTWSFEIAAESSSLRSSKRPMEPSKRDYTFDVSYKIITKRGPLRAFWTNFHSNGSTLHFLVLQVVGPFVWGIANSSL
ncbi:MAG: hypothetical protein ACE5OZ_23135 [Candidatus Heimdallarchaeota archaeon]